MRTKIISMSICNVSNDVYYEVTITSSFWQPSEIRWTRKFLWYRIGCWLLHCQLLFKGPSWHLLLEENWLDGSGVLLNQEKQCPTWMSSSQSRTFVLVLLPPYSCSCGGIGILHDSIEFWDCRFRMLFHFCNNLLNFMCFCLSLLIWFGLVLRNFSQFYDI